MTTTASTALRVDSLPPAELDLAEGFACHLLDWAASLGAPAASRAPLQRAALALARATAAGHVCVPLAALDAAPVAADDLSSLRAALLDSRVVVEAPVARTGASAHPLVLDGDGRLYLRRHFDQERALAAALRARAAAPSAAVAVDRALLDGLFPPRADGRSDQQKLAVTLALGSRLTVVSGGPGTGKTTTVAALLACLLDADPALRIALAAPTGKAAARMLEALRRRADALPTHLRALLPDEAYTVHRLLGVTPEPGRFRHHAGNPLALDVLVVDEASMLDLALAARLVDALPAGARLVLLGDKDQLAAVEAGAVFADLSAQQVFGAGLRARCAALGVVVADEVAADGGAAAGAGTRADRAVAAAGTVQAASAGRPVEGAGVPAAPLQDCVVWLSESHRFRADSGIGRLAADIRAGRGEAALDWLRAAADADAAWIDDDEARPAAETVAAIEAGYAAYFAAARGLASAAVPAGPGGRLEARGRGVGPMPGSALDAVFAAFDRFRVLVAVHGGGRGLAALNAHLERRLRAALGLPPEAGAASPWYAGRPLIVLRNDYLLGLYNGDVGLCLADDRGELAVHFPQADGGYRRVAPLRLPEHALAFALTVHKSQGSEFDEVLMVLPAQSARVLSRELLYTGVTRAARRVTLAGPGAVFIDACARPTLRSSGLRARLEGR